MKVRKAVFPAAGLGTRFLPATKAQPKEMMPLVDKPTIQYVVEEAVASGLSEMIIVTGRGNPPNKMPNDGDIANCWIWPVAHRDPALLHRILVENPRRLYTFREA